MCTVFYAIVYKNCELLNNNEYFKEKNIQKSTQTCIGKIYESRGAYK